MNIESIIVNLGFVLACVIALYFVYKLVRLLYLHHLINEAFKEAIAEAFLNEILYGTEYTNRNK